METRQTLKNRALETLSGNWGTGVVATIIYLVITSVASIAPIVSLVSFLIYLPLAWGVAVFFLRMVRNEDTEYARLFDGFNDYGRITLTMLLQSLYVFLWTLLLIIPGIVKSMSYAMTPFILRDQPNLKYNSAIEESMRMMEGHKMEYFLLQLSFLGWAILCVFTLGIGFLWLIPYVCTTNAHFYETLKEEKCYQQPI